MSRFFKFVRYDAAAQPLDEMTFSCLDEADALALGWRLGWRVEVWDGARPLGVVGDGAMGAAPATQPPSAASAPEGAPAAAPIAPAPKPILDVVPPSSGDVAAPVYSEPRAYNPFRKGSWRRRATP